MGTPRTECRAAPTQNGGLGTDLLPQRLDALGPPVPGAVAEPQLRACQRRPVGPGTQIAGVEQRESDACGGGAVDHGVSHRIGLGVGGAAGIVVHIVELADRGDARERHLGVHGPGEPPVAIGVHPLGGAVHQVPPGPERSTVALGP